MDYIHITLQKYTFSLKLQTIGADFLEFWVVICLKNAHANYANCKLRKLATSQSVRNTLHSNPHLAPLVGLCSVSTGYLIGG